MNAKRALSAPLGVVLRKYRLEAGMSQRELAVKSGHDRIYLGLVERGTLGLSLTLANDLARVLGRALSQLIMEAEQLRS